MTTTTRERNYRKHPHTARFLMTFHAAAQGLPAEQPAEDLLDEIPVEAPAFRPATAQRKLMADLLDEIAELDAETARRGSAYTLDMSTHNAWTPENTSRWIGRLIAKKRELVAAAKNTAPAAEVADGRYAVEEDGVLKFFKVTNGRVPGFVFLDVQASDEWHAIRNVTRIRKIVALIAEDAHAAMVRYGHELGECGRCGRTLTDEASRAAGIGPICAGK